MNIIPNLWAKLNILIPEPHCSTENEDYDLIVWNDSRAKPTAAKVKAVGYDPVKIGYIKSISNALQDALDIEAQKLGYDNINTAVSYADESAVASFQTDGISFRAWRSNVWAYAYVELAKWKAGGADPTIDSIITGMPTRV